MGWQRTEPGSTAHGPMPESIRMISFESRPPSHDVPITHEAVQDALRTITGADGRIKRLHQDTRWSDNTRQATSYRNGRVFLAGDAAHVHSPFGGQGLEASDWATQPTSAGSSLPPCAATLQQAC